jgi:carotenoid cleavage dioxygenase-like enzyme
MRVSELENPTNPSFVGNAAPVQDENNEICTEVIGHIPEELAGSFLRIGSNPVFVDNADAYHPFDGDGMIHEVNFKDGQATYINRFVDTKGLQLEREKGDWIWTGLASPPDMTNEHGMMKNVANTAMVFHAGKLLALWEGGNPHHLTLPNLDTVGEVTYDGRLNHPFTAHPKIDAKTGEMVTFGASLMSSPFCSVSVVDKNGELVHSTGVDLPKAIMMHDCAITSNYTLILDLPFTYNIENMAKGEPILQWDPDNGSRIGVLARGAEGSEIRWFTVENGFVFHTVNAFEEGDEVVLEACRSPRMGSLTDERPDEVNVADLPRLYQWRMNMKTGEVAEKLLDAEWGSEFPRINENYMGIRNQYSYNGRMPKTAGGLGFDGIIKYDLVNETSQHFVYGDKRYGGEPIFAPKAGGTDEDEGWVIGFIWDDAEQRSECVVLDAAKFDEGPVARIVMPARVPFGFHAGWVDQEGIDNQV